MKKVGLEQLPPEVQSLFEDLRRHVEDIREVDAWDSVSSGHERPCSCNGHLTRPPELLLPGISRRLRHNDSQLPDAGRVVRSPTVGNVRLRDRRMSTVQIDHELLADGGGSEFRPVASDRQTIFTLGSVILRIGS